MKALKLALGWATSWHNNKSGQVLQKGIQSILAFARSVGVDVLDMAFLYEKVKRT